MEVRVNILNIQLLQGPSQEIEDVLKISGSFVVGTQGGGRAKHIRT